MRTFFFYLGSILVGAALFAYARWNGNDYLFFAGYTVPQFVALATAWNILGGYCGYVNFGSARSSRPARGIRRWPCTSSAPMSTAISRKTRRHRQAGAAAQRADPDHHRRHRLGP